MYCVLECLLLFDEIKVKVKEVVFMVDEFFVCNLLKIIVVIENVKFVYEIYGKGLKDDYEFLFDKLCIEYYKM